MCRIEKVESGKDKAVTYSYQMERYKISIDQKFYLEAIVITYAMIEDRLLAYLHYVGVIDRRKQDQTAQKIYVSAQAQKQIKSLLKRKTDDSSYKRIQIFLNTNKDIYDVSSLSYSDKEFEIEYGIQYAYAELPHLYEKGDIVRCGDNYSVIADVIRHETLPPYMVHSDDTDMCLYCLGYYNDKVHSCGGSFGHEHIPLLKAEICSKDELPEGQKTLLALSRLFKGKIRIVDFLESYSNRDMDYLLK